MDRLCITSMMLSTLFSLFLFQKIRKYAVYENDRNDCIISVRYHAFLSDGTQTKLMSLKEILQKYLDYYKSSVTFENDEALCRKLTHLKELSPSRITIAKPNSVS